MIYTYLVLPAALLQDQHRTNWIFGRGVRAPRRPDVLLLRSATSSVLLDSAMQVPGIVVIPRTTFLEELDSNRDTIDFLWSDIF